MKTLSFLVCLTAAVFLCSGCSHEQKPTSRDRLILDAVASHFVSRDTEWSSLKWSNLEGVILIEQTTYVEHDPRTLDQYLLHNEFLTKQVDVALIKSFLSRNSKSVSFVGLKPTSQYRVMSDAEIQLIAAGTPPSDAKIGIVLYLPGVSPDGQRAYAQIGFLDRHGSHAHYVLAKRLDQWKVEASSVVINYM